LQFERYCQRRQLSWDTCRVQDLADYHQSLLWRHSRHGKLYSNHTVDLVLRTLRSFYRWAKQTQLITTDPTASWVLARPPQSEPPTLTQAQLLALLNLPDLGQPRGLRDQLLLELICWLSLSAAECRALQLDQVQGDHLEIGHRRLELEPCKLSLERYLTQGRPHMVKAPSPFLLLTNRARPYLADASVYSILRHYGQRLGLVCPLTTGLLHRSHRAQLEQLARRHSQPGR
jgi:integrase/recombinase XerD